MVTNREVTKTLLTLIKHYESLHDSKELKDRLSPVMCPAGFWTEGYGQLVRDRYGKAIVGNSKKDLAFASSVIYTEAQAEEKLIDTLVDLINDIKGLNVPMLQYEKDACTSFAYNVGFGAFKNSTLLKRIKDGSPHEEIEREFMRWDKANGKVLNGLVKRRKTEAYLFKNNELKFF